MRGEVLMVKRGMGAGNDFKWLRIFTGNSNIELIRKIAERLKTTIGKSVVKNFSDGEINVEIDESVRWMDVFAVQSICDRQ
jgi:ribose-phosphate pyrophosphokinase